MDLGPPPNLTRPRVSSTSLPVREPQPQAAPVAGSDAGQPGAAAPSQAQPAASRRGRPPGRPKPAENPLATRTEPSAELLEELGRLFWRAATESDGSVEAAAARVLEQLQKAKRLGEIATLLGVE